MIDLAEEAYGVDIKKKITQPLPTSGNKIEGLDIFRIDQVWQSDITYYEVLSRSYYIIPNNFLNLQDLITLPIACANMHGKMEKSRG